MGRSLAKTPFLLDLGGETAFYVREWGWHEASEKWATFFPRGLRMNERQPCFVCSRGCAGLEYEPSGLKLVELSSIELERCCRACREEQLPFEGFRVLQENPETKTNLFVFFEANPSNLSDTPQLSEDGEHLLHWLRALFEGTELALHLATRTLVKKELLARDSTRTLPHLEAPEGGNCFAVHECIRGVWLYQRYPMLGTDSEEPDPEFYRQSSFSAEDDANRENNTGIDECFWSLSERDEGFMIQWLHKFAVSDVAMKKILWRLDPDFLDLQVALHVQVLLNFVARKPGLITTREVVDGVGKVRWSFLCYDGGLRFVE